MLELTDLKPGDTLGRYEILMPVAQGGMAAVWAARMVGSRGFQKIVAIKTMLPGLSDDPDFETMFLDEARLASRIHHPHVVEIVDLGDDHGWLYLVMEWVDGETIFTLNKRAKTKGGIPLPILLRIISSACAGLHAAHELRDDKTGRWLELVHRDISPQNIMVSSNGIVKIVDFGVAKAAGRIHNTIVPNVVKGKVPYGSPEQLSGEKLDRRSDIFSLGILMYLMLSGFHPFRGDTDKKTMDNICKRAPVPLRELVPGVRSDVEAVVMRALEKDPEARWLDCASMQRAIDQALSALGAAITDGDVAAFVTSMLGDICDERRAKLATAIEHADNVAPVPSQPQPNSRRGGRPGVAGLPATFKGIIPVALDEDPPAPPTSTPPPVSAPQPSGRGSTPSQKRPKTIPPVVPSSKRPVTVPPTVPSSKRLTPVAASPTTPPEQPMIFAATRGRRSSSTPYVVLGALALVGGVAFAVRSGKLPWLADSLPAPVRDLILPAEGPPAPPPKGTSSAQSAASAASAAPSTAAATPSAEASSQPSSQPSATTTAAATPTNTAAAVGSAAPSALPTQPPTGVSLPPGALKRKHSDSPYDD